ncbi:Polysacc_synt_4 domain-containing protein [Cephalotus follicularis]|uniref:Polysacc_synt_4 domain-containing protein n=1 Tax=Cephalotus follicularis TaxID=3775 RepID=A0A1Q3BG18_CEPFO|nr:Polysacc_synt_4 domain-containing protein [Cephalotus follicularis]
MRSTTESPIILKLIITPIIICSFFLFLGVLTRTSFTSFLQNPSSIFQTSNSTNVPADPQESQSTTPTSCQSLPFTPACTKIPPSLANSLVHYATTKITPQQTLEEISVSLRILEKKSPCNFLVFGLGHDSLMWISLNHGGRTVFLEQDKSWIKKIQEKIPTLESYHVVYDTTLHQADELLKIGMQEEVCKVVTDPRFSKCQLAFKGFPTDVYDTEWDLIMVDAPTGYFDAAPGRMKVIYTAGLMARNRKDGETDVFLHDVDRIVEDEFSKSFLCEGYLVEQVGRIRHFNIPSHRTRLSRPYCP